MNVMSLVCKILIISHISFTKERNKRVVWGQPVFYPWIVALYRIDIPSEDWRCSGTLISKNLVLTAAHCVLDSPISKLFIVAGATYRYDKEGSIITIKEAIINPNYRRFHCTVGIAYESDVALLILNQPINCNSRTSIIHLPIDQKLHTLDPYKDFGSCTVAGWGETETGHYSNTQREAVVSIFQQNYCSKFTVYYDCYKEEKGMICAGDWRTKYTQDSCLGDSGGPLMCFPKNKKDVHIRLVGLVAWGRGCGKPTKPGVYMDVKHFLPWIFEVIERKNLIETIAKSYKQCLWGE